MVAEVTLGLQRVPFADSLLFPIGKFGGVTISERGLGPVAVQRCGPVLGIVGFELLGVGGDALALLAGPGLAVQHGQAAGEVEGVTLGAGFGDSELVDAAGELGAATTGEAAEPFEITATPATPNKIAG